ncbi:glycosyltransferase, partial [Marinobacter sp. bablab_jr003]
MEMRVSIVTVTYGNRASYVRQLVEAGLAAGACQIFIFDNGSPQGNRKELEAIVGGEEGVFLHSERSNLGSAGGFKKALSWASESASSSHFWILDDDNIPEKDALSSLVQAYCYLGSCQVNVLVSYRMLMDKVANKVVHKRELLDSVTKGFLVGQKVSLFSKIINKFKRNIVKPDSVINYPIVRRVRASWGGLFFHKSIIDDVGLPNESFYLYGDDFEYSDRMYDSGKEIFTVYQSRIIDIDSQPNSNGFFSESQSELKVYYAIRNHVYLDYRGDLLSCV